MTSLQKLPLNPQINTILGYPQEMECRIALSMYLFRSMEQTFVYFYLFNFCIALTTSIIFIFLQISMVYH